MNDIYESFKQQINERLNSPLIGAYLISWCLCNFKIFVVLCSDLSPVDKFAFIDAQTFADGLAFAKSFGIPLAISIVYVFAMPYPARWALVFTLNQNRINRQIQQKIDGQVLLTKNEAMRLQATVTERINALDTALEKKDVQIDKYKVQLKEYEDRLDELDLEVNEARGKASELNELKDSGERELQLLQSHNASLNAQVESLKGMLHASGKKARAVVSKGFIESYVNSSRNDDVMVPFVAADKAIQKVLKNPIAQLDPKVIENMKNVADLVNRSKILMDKSE